MHDLDGARAIQSTAVCCCTGHVYNLVLTCKVQICTADLAAGRKQRVVRLVACNRLARWLISICLWVARAGIRASMLRLQSIAVRAGALPYYGPSCYYFLTRIVSCTVQTLMCTYCRRSYYTVVLYMCTWALPQLTMNNTKLHTSPQSGSVCGIHVRVWSK